MEAMGSQLGDMFDSIKASSSKAAGKQQQQDGSSDRQGGGGGERIMRRLVDELKGAANPMVAAAGAAVEGEYGDEEGAGQGPQQLLSGMFATVPVTTYAR